MAKQLTGPEIVYYNVEILNPNSQNNSIYTPFTKTYPAQVVATNNIPIVDNPSDYYMTILSASIPLRQVPLFQILIQTPINSPADINTTIYSVGLQYRQQDGLVLAQSSQEFLIYSPRNNTTPPPYVYPAPVQLYTDYYFCYQVQQITDMMNEAMANALISLKTDPNAGPISAANPPYINYDATTQLLTIYTEEQYYNQDSSGNYIALYCNSLADPLFSGFPKVSVGNGTPSGFDRKFIIKSYNGLNVADGTIATTQNYTNYGYWSFLKKIIVGTNMNVNSEIFYVNQTLQQQKNTIASGGQTFQNQDYVNVLYSFLPDLSQLAGELSAASKIQLYNAPTNMYHPVTFNQKTPLYEVSVNVYVQDKFGNSFLLPLSVNDACDFKLQFIRKDLVKF